MGHRSRNGVLTLARNGEEVDGECGKREDPATKSNAMDGARNILGTKGDTPMCVCRATDRKKEEEKVIKVFQTETSATRD